MVSTSTRALTSGGFALSQEPARFGWLRDSSGVAEDFAELRHRMDADGYIYLPGYLNRLAVETARRSIMRSFADEELLYPGSDLMDGVARPGLNLYFRPDVANGSENLKAVIYGSQMMSFYKHLLGGEARHYDFTWMRAIAPGRGTSPHMDIVYMGRGTQRLYTAWVPLGDIPLEVGGLIVLENSHRYLPLQDTYAKTDVDTVCDNFNGQIEPVARGYSGFGAITDDPVALRDQVGGRWLTAQEFRMGDLLTFGMHTVHASLDNGSDRIRLSSDSRYQLASDPVDERWVGENPPAHGERSQIRMIC